MSKEKHQKVHLGEEVLAEWKAPEFRNLKKIKGFKRASLVIGGLLLTWAVYNSNFLFAFILVLGVFLIYFISDYRPKVYCFTVTDTGVWVDSAVYRFIEMDKFWVAPYATEKDRFFVFSLPRRMDLRVPVPLEKAEELRRIVNDYVPQSEHKINLFDLVDRLFL